MGAFTKCISTHCPQSWLRRVLRSTRGGLIRDGGRRSLTRSWDSDGEHQDRNGSHYSAYPVNQALETTSRSCGRERGLTRDHVSIRSIHLARDMRATNGSAKYCVSRATL